MRAFWGTVLLLFSFLLTGGSDSLASSREASAPSLVEFRSIIAKNYTLEVAPPDELERLKAFVGQVTYVSHNFLQSGQSRFSYFSVLAKILEAPQRYSLKWNEDSNRWDLPSDEGRALLPETRSARGVLSSSGVVLIDGHHKVLESLYFGSKTAPVEIVADWSHMDEKHFWKEMEKRRYTFLYTIRGEKLKTPPNLAKLEDDPLRYFFKMASLTVKTRFEAGKYRIIKRSGLDKNPLAIRVDQHIPFFELYGAQALHRGGFSHTPSFGEDFPESLLTEARKVLLGERDRGDSILHQMLLLEGDEDLSDQAIETLINDNYIYISCEDLLLSPLAL